MALTISKISSADEFAELETVWNDLLSASVSNTISLTWEWLWTWWEVFAQGRSLYLLVARDGNEIAGIAPLQLRVIRHYSMLPFRRLEFLASGEDEADEICSPYLDFIIRAGREQEVIREFYSYLMEHETDWDELVLTDIAADSICLSHLRSMCQTDGTGFSITRRQTSIHTVLPHNWESLKARLSTNMRKKIKQGQRIVAEQGGELRLIERQEDFAENFETLINLHQTGWAQRGQAGAFASPLFSSFHWKLADRIFARGWIRLYVLLIEGNPVCAHYDFNYNRKALFYQTGRIVTNCVLPNPGITLESYILEKAIEDGLTEYDHLKGEKGSYKFRWDGQVREIVQIRMAPPRVKETILSVTEKFIDGLRQVRRTLIKPSVVEVTQ